MISGQPELNFTEPTEKGPQITSGEIGLLLNILTGAGWLKAAQIRTHEKFTAEYGILTPDDAARHIRAIANASAGQILSYPGSPGYKLTREATIKEIQTATAKLRHQATEMERRALTIDRVYHGKVQP